MWLFVLGSAIAWPLERPAHASTGARALVLAKAIDRPPRPDRGPGLVRRGWRVFHRFSLRKGMLVGTGLIVGGVAGGEALVQLGHEDLGSTLAVVPPMVGVKMNAIALGARLHRTYGETHGRRIGRVARTVWRETDAAGMKVWSLGVKAFGLGLAGSHAGSSIPIVSAIAHVFERSAIGLIAAGVALHIVPRAAQAAARLAPGRRAAR
jgi:hypothetical protein